MILDFNAMPANDVPHFKGGEGHVVIRKYDDPRMGAAVRLTVPALCSIVLHPHPGKCALIYVLSGSGLCTDDGAENPLTARKCHYSPEGHSHRIRNTGSQPLELLAALPLVK